MEHFFWSDPLTLQIETGRARAWPVIKASVEEYETRVSTKVPKRDWHFLSAFAGSWSAEARPVFASMLEEGVAATADGYLVLEFISTQLTMAYYDALGLGIDDQQVAAKTYLEQLSKSIMDRRPAAELSYIPHMYLMIRVAKTDAAATASSDQKIRNFLKSLAGGGSSEEDNNKQAKIALSDFLGAKETWQSEVRKVGVQVRDRKYDGAVVPVNHTVAMLTGAALNAYNAASIPPFPAASSSSSSSDPWQKMQAETQTSISTGAVAIPMSFQEGAGEASAAEIMAKKQSEEFSGEDYDPPGLESLTGYQLPSTAAPGDKFQIAIKTVKPGIEPMQEEDEQERIETRRSVLMFLLFWVLATAILLFALYRMTQFPETREWFVKEIGEKFGMKFTYAGVISVLLVVVGLVVLGVSLGAELHGANAVGVAYVGVTGVFVGVFLYLLTFTAKVGGSEHRLRESMLETVAPSAPPAPSSSSSSAPSSSSSAPPPSAPPLPPSLTPPAPAATLPPAALADDKVIRETMVEPQVDKEAMEAPMFTEELAQNIQKHLTMPFHVQSYFSVMQTNTRVMINGKQEWVATPCRVLGTIEEGKVVYVPQWAQTSEDQNDRIDNSFPVVLREDLKPWEFLSGLNNLLQATNELAETYNEKQKQAVEQAVANNSKKVSLTEDFEHELDLGKYLRVMESEIQAAAKANIESAGLDVTAPTGIEQSKQGEQYNVVTAAMFSELLRKACSDNTPLSVNREIQLRDSLEMSKASETKPALVQQPRLNYNKALLFGGAGSDDENDDEKSYVTSDEPAFVDDLLSPRRTQRAEAPVFPQHDGSADTKSHRTASSRSRSSSGRSSTPKTATEFLEEDTSGNARINGVKYVHKFCTLLDGVSEIQSWADLTQFIDEQNQDIIVSKEEEENDDDGEGDDAMDVDVEDDEEDFNVEHRGSENDAMLDNDDVDAKAEEFQANPSQEEQTELGRYLVDIFSKLAFAEQGQENIVSLNLAFYSLIGINLFVPLAELDSFRPAQEKLHLDQKMQKLVAVMNPTAKLFWLMVPPNEDFEETVYHAIQETHGAKAAAAAQEEDDDEKRPVMDKVCDRVLPNEPFPFVHLPELYMLRQIEKRVHAAKTASGGGSSSSNRLDNLLQLARASGHVGGGPFSRVRRGMAAVAAAMTGGEEPSPSPFANLLEEAIRKTEEEEAKMRFKTAAERAHLLGVWSTAGKQTPEEKSKVVQSASSVIEKVLDPAGFKSLYENAAIQRNTLDVIRDNLQRRSQRAQTVSKQFPKYTNLAIQQTATASFFLDDEMAFGGQNTLNQRIFESAMASLTRQSLLTDEERSSEQYTKATSQEKVQFELDRRRAVLLHVCKVISLCMDTLLYYSRVRRHDLQEDKVISKSAELLYWFYRPLQITLQAIMCTNITEVYKEAEKRGVASYQELAAKGRMLRRATNELAEFPQQLNNMYVAASLFGPDHQRRRQEPVSQLHWYLTDVQHIRVVAVPRSKPTNVSEEEWKEWAKSGMLSSAVAAENPKMSVLLYVPIASDHLAAMNADYRRLRPWSIYDLSEEEVWKSVVQYMKPAMNSSSSMRRGIASVPVVQASYMYELKPDALTKDALQPWWHLKEIKRWMDASPIFRNDAFMMLALSNAVLVLTMQQTKLKDYQGMNWFFSLVFVDWFLYTHMAMLPKHEFFLNFVKEGAALPTPSTPPPPPSAPPSLISILQVAMQSLRDKLAGNEYWLCETDPVRFYNKAKSTTAVTDYRIFYMHLTEWDNYAPLMHETTFLFAMERLAKSNNLLLHMLGDVNIQSIDADSQKVARELVSRYFAKNPSLNRALYRNNQDFGLLLLTMEESNHHETDRATFLRNDIVHPEIVNVVTHHLSNIHQLTEDRLPPDLHFFALGPQNRLLYYLLHNDASSFSSFVMNIGDFREFVFETENKGKEVQGLAHSDLVKDINALRLLFNERVELLRLFLRCIAFLNPPGQSPSIHHFEPSCFLDFCRSYLAIVAISFAHDNPYFAVRAADNDDNTTSTDYQGIQYYMSRLAPFARTVVSAAMYTLGNEERYRVFAKEASNYYSLARRSLSEKLATTNNYLVSLMNTVDAVQKVLQISQKVTPGEGDQQKLKNYLSDIQDKVSQEVERAKILQTKINEADKYSILEQEQSRYYMCSLSLAVYQFTKTEQEWSIYQRSMATRRNVSKTAEEVGSYIQLFFYFLFAFSDLENEGGDWFKAHLSLEQQQQQPTTLRQPSTEPRLAHQLHSTLNTFFPMIYLSIGRRIMKMRLKSFSPVMMERLRAVFAAMPNESTTTLSNDQVIDHIVRTILADSSSPSSGVKDETVFGQLRDSVRGSLREALRDFFSKKRMGDPEEAAKAAAAAAAAAATTTAASTATTTMSPEDEDDEDDYDEDDDGFYYQAGSLLDSLKGLRDVWNNYFGKGGSTITRGGGGSASDAAKTIIKSSGMEKQLAKYRENLKKIMSSLKWEPRLKTAVERSLSLEDDALAHNIGALMDGIDWNPRDFCDSVFADSYLTSAYRQQPESLTQKEELVTLRVNKRFVTRFDYRQETFEEEEPQLAVSASSLRAKFQKERPWIFTEIIQRMIFLQPAQRHSMGFMLGVLETPNQMLKLRNDATFSDTLTKQDWTKMFTNAAACRFRWSLHQYVMCFLTIYWLNHSTGQNTLFEEPVIYECMVRAYALVIYPWSKFLADPDNDTEKGWMRMLSLHLSPQVYRLQFRKWKALQVLNASPGSSSSSSTTEFEQQQEKMVTLGFMAMSIYSILWSLPPTEEFWRTEKQLANTATIPPQALSEEFSRSERDLAQTGHLTVFWPQLEKEFREAKYQLYYEWVACYVNEPTVVATIPTSVTSKEERVSCAKIIETCISAMHIMDTQLPETFFQDEEESSTAAAATATAKEKQSFLLKYYDVIYAHLYGPIFKRHIVARSIMYISWRVAYLNIHHSRTKVSLPDVFVQHSDARTADHIPAIKERIQLFLNIEAGYDQQFLQTYMSELLPVGLNTFIPRVKEMEQMIDNMVVRRTGGFYDSQLEGRNQVMKLLGSTIGNKLYERIDAHSRAKLSEPAIWWAIDNSYDLLSVQDKAKTITAGSLENKLEEAIANLQWWLLTTTWINTPASVAATDMILEKEFLAAHSIDTDVFARKMKAYIESVASPIRRFATTDSSIEASFWRTQQRRRGRMAMQTNPQCRVFTLVPDKTSQTVTARPGGTDIYQKLLARKQNPLLISESFKSSLELEDIMRVRSWSDFMATRWELAIYGRLDLVTDIDGVAYVQLRPGSMPVLFRYLAVNGSFIDADLNEEQYFFEPGFLFTEFGADVAASAIASARAPAAAAAASATSATSAKGGAILDGLIFNAGFQGFGMGLYGANQLLSSSNSVAKPRVKPLRGVQQEVRELVSTVNSQLAKNHDLEYNLTTMNINALYKEIVLDQVSKQQTVTIYIPPLVSSKNDIPENRLLWFNLFLQLQRMQSVKMRGAVFDALAKMLADLERDPSLGANESVLASILENVSDAARFVLVKGYRWMNSMVEDDSSSSSGTINKTEDQAAADLRREFVKLISKMLVNKPWKNMVDRKNQYFRQVTTTDARDKYNHFTFSKQPNNVSDACAATGYKEVFVISSPSDSSIAVQQPDFAIFQDGAAVKVMVHGKSWLYAMNSLHKWNAFMTTIIFVESADDMLVGGRFMRPEFYGNGRVLHIQFNKQMRKVARYAHNVLVRQWSVKKNRVAAAKSSSTSAAAVELKIFQQLVNMHSDKYDDVVAAPPHNTNDLLIHSWEINKDEVMTPSVMNLNNYLGQLYTTQYLAVFNSNKVKEIVLGNEIKAASNWNIKNSDKVSTLELLQYALEPNRSVAILYQNPFLLLMFFDTMLIYSLQPDATAAAATALTLPTDFQDDMPWFSYQGPQDKENRSLENKLVKHFTALCKMIQPESTTATAAFSVENETHLWYFVSQKTAFFMSVLALGWALDIYGLEEHDPRVPLFVATYILSHYNATTNSVRDIDAPFTALPDLKQIDMSSPSIETDANDMKERFTRLQWPTTL